MKTITLISLIFSFFLIQPLLADARKDQDANKDGFIELNESNYSKCKLDPADPISPRYSSYVCEFGAVIKLTDDMIKDSVCSAPNNNVGCDVNWPKTGAYDIRYLLKRCTFNNPPNNSGNCTFNFQVDIICGHSHDKKNHYFKDGRWVFDKDKNYLCEKI